MRSIAAVAVAVAAIAAGCSNGSSGSAATTSSSTSVASTSQAVSGSSGATSTPSALQALDAAFVDVVARVGPSVVEISTPSGLGSGIIYDTAGDIVTNAHVVAGESSTTVLRPDGRQLPAIVALFDSDRDLAVLRVRGLGETPLGIASAAPGSVGAVFGHPGGQNAVQAAPAAIKQEVEALGRDLYDAHPTRRQVFVLASDLHPGDSGGALVDRAGAVVGVAFAIAPDQPGTAYALTTAELRPDLAATGAGRVSTGACLND